MSPKFVVDDRRQQDIPCGDLVEPLGRDDELVDDRVAVLEQDHDAAIVDDSIDDADVQLVALDTVVRRVVLDTIVNGRFSRRRSGVSSRRGRGIRSVVRLPVAGAPAGGRRRGDRAESESDRSKGRPSRGAVSLRHTHRGRGLSDKRADGFGDGVARERPNRAGLEASAVERGTETGPHEKCGEDELIDPRYSEAELTRRRGSR